MKNLGIGLYRKCCKCSSPGSCRMDGSYVTILYEADAEEWSIYITSCFSHILKLVSSNEWSIHPQPLKDIELPLNSARIGKFKRSRLQVIILSPKFLVYVAKHPDVVLARLFDPQRVICLLCGVTTEDVTATHRASLANYDNWHKMIVVDNDTDFAQRLFALTEKLLKEDSNYDSYTETIGFKLNPCKVRENFPKVTIELEDPINNASKVSVFMETETDEKEIIPLTVKQYNPYTLKICIPDRFFGFTQVVGIHVNNDGECLGQRPLKCESKMAEFDQLLNSILDPLSFMCQTLGLPSIRTNREGLDKYLVESFRKNTASSGMYVFELNDEESSQRKTDDELPTLLHWSAKYGLEELCSVLLDCPKAAQACRLKNRQGLTAADVAELNNFSCLANMLENYMRLSETAEMYIYMKNMTETMQSVEYEGFGANYLEECTTRTSTVESLSTRRTVSMMVDEAGNSSLPQGVNNETKPDNVRQLTDTEVQMGLRNRHLYNTCNQELIQLFEDFKKEKYTLSEVELLCQNLQLSHRSRSFNEKQEQLRSMRQQYERAQKERHQADKKLSAFERFQTLFKKPTKKETHISSPIIKVTTSYVKPQADSEGATGNLSPKTGIFPFFRPKTRPASSWSSGSRSSSLSDRSSTMSGVSSGSASDSAVLCDIGEDIKEDRVTAQKFNFGPYSSGKNALPFMAQNMQYLETGDQRSLLSPKGRSSSAPNKNHTPSPHRSIANSRSDDSRLAKPMPPPRPLETLNPANRRNKAFNASTLPSCDTVDDEMYCPLEPAPLPPCSDESESQPNFQPGGHYLVMEGSKSSPAILQSHSYNNLLADEPHYCNLPAPLKDLPGDYMDMKANSGQPSISIRGHGDRTQYVNVVTSYEDFSDDRYDSVPDIPPPAVPDVYGLTGTSPNKGAAFRPQVPPRY